MIDDTSLSLSAQDCLVPLDRGLRFGRGLRTTETAQDSVARDMLPVFSGYDLGTALAL